ncbi:hypothetical protein Dimus_010834 [Dionaea muscipula]
MNKWEKLFTKRDLVFKTECCEFYKNLTVSITWKKEVAKSRVNGTNIEFDGITLATILNIPENNGICDYIKEVWEESKYCKPLEITKKFANNENIVEARRVKSVEMQPFHRLLQIFVMKNLVPRFGKRDVTGFMDLTYMDYLLTKKKVNLPRVIIRHMAYVIKVPNHELPYSELLTRIFEAFNVPLNHKKGEDPKRYDYFDETFLNVSIKERRWCLWLGLGANRRNDDDEAPAENVENVEMNEGEEVQKDFDWVQVEEDAEIQGEEHAEKGAEVEDSGSSEKFFDVMDDVEDPADVIAPAPDVTAPVPAIPDVLVPVPDQQKGKTVVGVDPSGSSGSMLELLNLQGLSRGIPDFRRCTRS